MRLPLPSLLAKKSRPTYPSLSAEKSLESLILLGALIKTYSPLLAAIVRAKGEPRAWLVQRLCDALSKDEKGLRDVAMLYENLVGKPFNLANAKDLLIDLPGAWQYHKIPELISVGMALGLLTKEDLVDFEWLERNIVASQRLAMLEKTEH